MVMNNTRAVAVRIHDVSPESVAAATISASSAQIAMVEATSKLADVIIFRME